MADMPDFRLHDGEWAVCRLDPSAPWPEWATTPGRFCSLSRSGAELSVVCPAEVVPPGVRAQTGWALVELIGPFDFALTGILASVLVPLAAAAVPIFALSTFDTDWVLVPREKLATAVRALRDAGHNEI